MKAAEKVTAKRLLSHPLFRRAHKRPKTARRVPNEKPLLPKLDRDAPFRNHKSLIQRVPAKVPTKSIFADDSDDDFSISDLDNPDVIAPWKPKPPVKFRWRVGTTVEMAGSSKFSDFCTIVGTNSDGTYNLQDIITKTYKKNVPESRILGNYEDFMKAAKQSKSKKTKNNTKTINQDNDNDSDDSDSDSSNDSDYDLKDYCGDDCAYV